MDLHRKENSLFFKANVEYDGDNILFAAYLFKNNQKVEQILYQNISLFKFNYFGDGNYKVRFFCKIGSTNIPKIKFSKDFNI